MDDVFWKCFAGGAGCGCAGFLTNPCDVVKIRNQQYGAIQTKYANFVGTFRVIWAEEGISGFMKGARATVLREFTYSSLRMGLYEPIKSQIKLFTGAPENSLTVKWCSSFVSGAIGSAIFNPIDLVKVRFQSSVGNVPPYNNSIIGAFRAVYSERGLSGLYAGVSATVVRAAFLTSAQLGTYDIIKNNLLVDKFGMRKEDDSTHFLASLLTSVVATTAANPADVIKTRVMNAGTSACTTYGNGSSSTKTIDEITVRKPSAQAVDVFKTEGIRGFFRGWTASYCRIGPHTIISFVLIEKIRQLIGLQSY